MLTVLLVRLVSSVQRVSQLLAACWHGYAQEQCLLWREQLDTSAPPLACCAPSCSRRRAAAPVTRRARRVPGVAAPRRVRGCCFPCARLPACDSGLGGGAQATSGRGGTARGSHHAVWGTRLRGARVVCCPEVCWQADSFSLSAQDPPTEPFTLYGTVLCVSCASRHAAVPADAPSVLTARSMSSSG